MCEVASVEWKKWFARPMAGVCLGVWMSLMAASSATADEVTVAWDPNPEPDIAEYLVYYGPTAGVATNVLSAGTGTQRTVSSLQSATEYWFYVTAKNIAGLESDPSAVIVHTTGTTGPSATAPTITSSPLPAAATVGAAYTHTVTANGTAPITFSATGLPPGVTISSAGSVSGVPTTAGTFNGTVTAANGTLPNATQAFSITVVSPQVAPAIVGANPPRTGTEGQGYSYQFSATGNPQPTFSATGLPNGLSISPNGLLSGSPTTEGSFSVVITAANGIPVNATYAYTLSVARNTDPGQPPAVSFDGDRLILVAATYSPRVNVSDDNLSLEELSYSWTQVSGPVCTINNADQLKPTISLTEKGDYRFRVAVSDGGSTVAAEFTLHGLQAADKFPPGAVVPNIQFVQPSLDGNIIAFDSKQGRTYWFALRDDLNDPSWLVIGNPVPSTGSTTYAIDDRDDMTSSGFYGIFQAN